MQRIQLHPHTQLLRNPGPLATARAYLAGRGGPGEPLRILSFGCSIGDELASMKLYFPTARLFGCDIDETALATARRSVGGLAEIFASTAPAIAARGPFDLICAMSSLCIHPPPPGDFGQTFSFARFEAVTALLTDALAPGGLFALYNGSYLFQRARAFAGFTPLRSDVICRNGFVDIHDEAGRIMVQYATSPSGVPVRAVRAAGDLDDYDLVDTVFAKTGRTDGDPIHLTLYDPGALRAGEFKLAFTWTRSELDGFAPADRAPFIDMRRAYRAWASPRGETLHEFDVSRSRLDGSGELLLATYGPDAAQLGDKV